MEHLPYELIDLVCEWLTLHEISNISLINKYFHQLIQQNQFYLFCKANYNIDEYIYIYNLMDNFNHFQRFYLCRVKKYNINHTFVIACGSGYLEIAKWLKQIYPKINISEHNYLCFLHACGRGHLDTAKWIKQICPEINTELADCAFQCACSHGHLEVVIRLRAIFPEIDIQLCDDSPFRVACVEGYLEIAQWLKQICPEINVRACGDFALKYACLRNHLGIVEFLKTIYYNQHPSYYNQHPSILENF